MGCTELQRKSGGFAGREDEETVRSQAQHPLVIRGTAPGEMGAPNSIQACFWHQQVGAVPSQGAVKVRNRQALPSV